MQNLINSIDNYLLAEEGHKRTAHYASDVSACLRQLFFKWTEARVSNPIEAGALWKMNFGNAIHDLVATFLDKAGHDVITEVPDRVSIDGLKYPISFRIDNIFIDDDTQMAGIEVKTSFGRGIVEIQKSGSPRDSDVNQVVVYMRAVPDIKRFYILYFGRDNGYRCQFIVNRDVVEKVWPTLQSRLESLEVALESNLTPPRDYRAAIKHGERRKMFQKNNVKYKSDWQCDYCKWADMCWESELREYAEGDNSEDFA